jgi:hypothetical protein
MKGLRLECSTSEVNKTRGGYDSDPEVIGVYISVAEFEEHREMESDGGCELIHTPPRGGAGHRRSMRCGNNRIECMSTRGVPSEAKELHAERHSGEK